LSIQKTSIESQYLLLVSRVVEEGEELEDGKLYSSNVYL
jgi:hypothetical protein